MTSASYNSKVQELHTMMCTKMVSPRRKIGWRNSYVEASPDIIQENVIAENLQDYKPCCRIATTKVTVKENKDKSEEKRLEDVPTVEARKEENFGTEDLHGMIKNLEPRADGTLCLKNRSWIPLFGEPEKLDYARVRVPILQFLANSSKKLLERPIRYDTANHIMPRNELVKVRGLYQTLEDMLPEHSVIDF
ncbi:hypothetical protein Tco_0610965 [Tanacetum coccineum]